MINMDFILDAVVSTYEWGGIVWNGVAAGRYDTIIVGMEGFKTQYRKDL